MTKSFTASAILLLRDEGRSASTIWSRTTCPTLAAGAPPTPRLARITIRHLLTMTAGFPTDDPWGDRQQGLPLDEFARVPAAGPGFDWPPGARFEYSNLGYGILGRVITRGAGAGVPGLRPRPAAGAAGDDATGYDRGIRGPAADRLGARLRGGDGRWSEEADRRLRRVRLDGRRLQLRARPHPLGARLPRRVPGPRRPGRRHPLRRASRREMQQAVTGPGRGGRRHPAHEAPVSRPAATATGCGRRRHAGSGRSSGTVAAIPGYGTHMVWHPHGPRRHRRGQPPLRGGPPRRGRAARALVAADGGRRPAAAPDAEGHGAARAAVERLLARGTKPSPTRPSR